LEVAEALRNLAKNLLEAASGTIDATDKLEGVAVLTEQLLLLAFDAVGVVAVQPAEERGSRRASAPPLLPGVGPRTGLGGLDARCAHTLALRGRSRASLWGCSCASL